jgi:hypothetical protein
MLINVCRRSAATHGRLGLENKGGEKNKINILLPASIQTVNILLPASIQTKFQFCL